MWNPEKREKTKHTKTQKWWNDFTILGDKKFAKAVCKGKPKRAKGNFFEKMEDIFQEMKEKERA